MRQFHCSKRMLLLVFLLGHLSATVCISVGMFVVGYQLVPYDSLSHSRQNEFDAKTVRSASVASFATERK